MKTHPLKEATQLHKKGCFARAYYTISGGTVVEEDGGNFSRKQMTRKNIRLVAVDKHGYVKAISFETYKILQNLEKSNAKILNSQR